MGLSYGVIGISFRLLAVVVMFIVVFWMVCAWKAMRAHAKLAESVQKLSRNIIRTE